MSGVSQVIAAVREGGLGRKVRAPEGAMLANGEGE